MHVLFGGGYLLFVYFQYTLFNKKINTKASLVSDTLIASVNIAASYLTVYLLLPCLLFKKKLENILPSGKFMPIHKPFLVTLDKIASIDRNHVNIGKERFPDESSYRKELFKVIEKRKIN